MSLCPWNAATQCFIVLLCDESWWVVPVWWFIWIPMALWMLIQSLTQSWINGNDFSVFPWLIPFDALQRNQWLCKESFAHLWRVTKCPLSCGWFHGGQKERWRLYLLVDSSLCLLLRRAAEAGLLLPGILASHSNSSGRRTARPWR